ncbi:MAG: HAD family phosphatase [Bacteroidota bacterium]
MKEIKHVIFDLGEVIINIAPGAVKEIMIRRGITNVDEMYHKLLEEKIYYRLETGEISPDEFRSAIKKNLNKPITDADINEAWNAMILDIPQERIKFMTRLKSKYKLYLLSNTNDIHWKYYDRYFRETYDYPSINTFFTKTWYSYLMGVRKPDPEIFRMALEDGHLDPAETAFIDDLKENVDAAATLGIHPVHLEPGKEIMDLFDENLYLKS